MHSDRYWVGDGCNFHVPLCGSVKRCYRVSSRPDSRNGYGNDDVNLKVNNHRNSVDVKINNDYGVVSAATNPPIFPQSNVINRVTALARK